MATKLPFLFIGHLVTDSPSPAKRVPAVKWEKTRVARPRRLTLQTPVRYRTKGLGRWHEGLTENLSHSGVLLHGPQQLSECTLVELILEMPEQISGQKNSMVLCQARIVRHVEVQESKFTGMAASFLDYRFLPRS